MRNPYRNQQKEQEVYAVPPSDGSLIYTSEQRVALLDKWRQVRRYKLSADERAALTSLKTWQANISTLTYCGIAATWWITGTRHDAAFYERFGLKATPDGFLKDWLRVQKFKLQWNIVARITASFTVSIPFVYWLATVQATYFEATLRSPTVFGGFARYLQQQGDRTTNGELVEKYRPGHLYNETRATTRKVTAQKGEMLADCAGDMNYARPEAPQREPQPQPQQHFAEGGHTSAPQHNGVASPPPLSDRSSVWSAVAAQQPPGKSGGDPTDQFLAHVFGRW